MLRNIAAVLAGLIVGMIVNMLLVQINTLIFPLPEGVNMMDSEQMRSAIRQMPPASWIGVFIAHLGQAFVGAWLAAKIGKSHQMVLAMIVGVLALLGGIANALMLATPAWTWIEMPLYLVAAWFGGKLGCRK